MDTDTQETAPTAEAKKPIYKRWWAIALAAVFVISGISQAMAGGSDTPSADAATTAAQPAQDDDSAASTAKATDTDAEPVKAKPKPKPKPATVSVKAGKLVKDFEDNELAADAKYDGKTLKITGVVDKIDTDIWHDDKYILQLGGGSDFEVWTVNCHDMSTDELSKLAKGDTVTVVGKFKDGGDLGVEVEDTELA